MKFVYVYDLSESDETLKSTFSNIDDRHNLPKMTGSLVADGNLEMNDAYMTSRKKPIRGQGEKKMKT